MNDAYNCDWGQFMKSIERFAELLTCPSEDEWRGLMLRLGEDLGYGQMLFAVIPNPQAALEKDNAFLCSSYSPEWLGWYSANKLEYIDPVVSHCAQRTTPLIWSPEIFSSKPQKYMYEEASSHGLRAGISLPMHGANGEKGLLSFVNDSAPGKRFQREVVRYLPDLLMMRDFALDAATQFMRSAPDNKEVPVLTQRELECLKWSAAGKSSWEIGQILRCSEAVVNFHIGNVRRKFDVTSRRHAVAKAIQLGLIKSV
jgi:LuxR family quorum-sensing transcriptional regulator LasR